MSNSRPQSGPQKNPRRSGNPATRAQSGGTSGGGAPRTPAAANSFRGRLERFSAPILVTLAGLPRWFVPIALGLILFGGLVLTGQWTWLGGVLLTFVSLVVVWLTALSWPLLTGSSRVVRVVIAAALIGVTVLKFMGRF